MSAVIQTVLRIPACLMKTRRSAISHSRPRGAPSPCATASPLTTPSGRSAAMIFQVACEFMSSRLSQDICAGPRIAAAASSSPQARAIGAHVQQEDIEQRPIGDLAVDPPGFGQGLAHRHEFVEGAASARRQGENAFVDVASPAGRLARTPVVGDFVIIPLRKQRHLGIEREQILVEQVVFVVAAKLRERLGDLGFLLGHDVLPHASVRQLPLRLESDSRHRCDRRNE